MTQPQFFAIAIVAAMMALFVWGRLRYDLVAVLALLASIAAGTVPAKAAFSGFSDDIVIIVASALVVSAAIARSGVIETLLARPMARAGALRWQLLLLVGAVAALSALVKNIGALAMLMPAALRMAKKSGASPSAFLMPMSFASLLGGLVTLVGTSPNIIVSRVREQISGQPFGMFDYTPVGLGLVAAGILFLSVGYQLIPKERRAPPTMGEALNIADYTTQAAIPADSPAIGQDASAFEAANDGDIEVAGVMRGGRTPPAGSALAQGDTLILKGDPDALERAIAAGGLALEGQHRSVVTDAAAEDVGVIEAVVTADSLLAGRTAAQIGLHERHGVNLLAVARQGRRMSQMLRDMRLRAGDVVVLQGPLERLPEQLAQLGCLPLAERPLRLGGVRRGIVPVVILACAMGLTLAGIAPVAVAFFGAAALVMLSGALPPREAYDHIDWPILVMLGALIPVSEALHATGVTAIMAAWLSAAAGPLPPWGAVALIMAAAMAVTPFLNNAATVLVMAPVAAAFAQNLGMRPEAFLMAVAVGAGSDFLTPIGHQCNTLVWGPGGYRFGDYARLGAPLSMLVLAVGVPLILMTWPLR